MKATSLTTVELFQQISEGDESAFTILFHRYADKIYSYSLKIVHTKFWAEEAVQNLFTQVWQHRESLTHVDNPEAYIFRMASNRCIDILRANEKAVRVHTKDSIWYTSGGPVHSSLATKFLMMYPGLDRCSTIGFRCVTDL